MSAHRRLVVVFATPQFYRRTLTPDVTAPRASKPPQLTGVAGVGQASRGTFAGGAGGKFSPVGFRPESDHDRLSQRAATLFHSNCDRQGLWRCLTHSGSLSAELSVKLLLSLSFDLIAGLYTKCAHTTCTETIGADLISRCREGSSILFVRTSGSRVIDDDPA
jgi:hypothetical protein